MRIVNLNYTSSLRSEIQQCDDVLKQFLKESFADILVDNAKQEAILGNLYHEDQTKRYNKIMTLLNEITHGL